MKKYWIHYYRPFGNTYDLYYTESKEEEQDLPTGAMRITRRKAIDFAKYARSADAQGYASEHIYPASGYWAYPEKGYIMERR